jgi:ketosteroid isomerase-like protein
VIGKWFLKRKSGVIGGIYTLLFRKFNGGWRIVVDHTS